MSKLAAGSPLVGASTAPCTPNRTLPLFSTPIRTCGSHNQRLPAAAKSGVPIAAGDTGFTALMSGDSWPIMSSALDQVTVSPQAIVCTVGDGPVAPSVTRKPAATA